MEKINLKTIARQVKSYCAGHKKLSIVLMVVIIAGGYFGYQKLTSTTGETRYITANVKKGTIVTSITGSGQILASNQIDIKPKASGEIVWVGAQPGDTVYAGKALMSIDGTDAKRAIVSAEQTLATSKLQYQKDSASAPIDYQKSLDTLASAEDDLNNTFSDSFNTLSNVYLDMSGTITGAQNILYGYDLSPTGQQQWNVDVLNNMFNSKTDDKTKLDIFTLSAKNDYATARTKYDASVLVYKQITRISSQDAVYSLLTQSIDTTTAVAQALQSELNFLGAITDLAQYYSIKLPATVTTIQTNARSYLSTTNSDLSSLLSQKKSIDASKQAIKTAKQNIALLQVGNSNAGDNPISLQISKNNIATQEQTLAQSKEDLSNYTIVAPFDGKISAVNAKIGDNASGSAVASIITNQTLAQISLNEVDVAKIKVGEKATLTFDAIDGLTITGSVVEIDTVGTVSQGVASYYVKINLDTQDPRIRPGMTANAGIQTAVHQDVLYVPSGAVKTSGGRAYVLSFNPPLAGEMSAAGITSKVEPGQIPVTTGISDDTNIEILSGLTEGEQIVTRVITSAAAKAAGAPSATSLLGGGGSRSSGVRIGG